MRNAITSLLELTGAAILSYGCYLAYEPLGFIIAGGCLAGVGYLAAEQNRSES